MDEKGVAPQHELPGPTDARRWSGSGQQVCPVDRNEFTHYRVTTSCVKLDKCTYPEEPRRSTPHSTGILGRRGRTVPCSTRSRRRFGPPCRVGHSTGARFGWRGRVPHNTPKAKYSRMRNSKEAHVSVPEGFWGAPDPLSLEVLRCSYVQRGFGSHGSR